LGSTGTTGPPGLKARLSLGLGCGGFGFPALTIRGTGGRGPRIPLVPHGVLAVELPGQCPSFRGGTRPTPRLVADRLACVRPSTIGAHDGNSFRFHV
jgi:hypothetical protein